MNYFKSFTTAVLIAFVSSSFAQSPEVSIHNPAPVPVAGPVLKPFHMERRQVSAAKLSNSRRLESLVRAGNLYLSVRDVIALVLENNIDIAIQRYGPYLAREALRRAEGGGAIRDIGTPIYPGPESVSTTGVTVSAVGLPETGGVGSGGGIVLQYGTQPPNLDPSIFAYASFQHSTTPLSNTLLNEIPYLVNDSRIFQFGYQQSWLTGTGAQLTYTSSRNSLNSPANALNPYTAGQLDLYLTQNLLQGWGVAVNNRYIRVVKNNMKVTDLQVKLQVITTISAALNLYWDLVSFNEDLRIKQQALETAQKLYEDNKKQVELGTLSAIEVTRAAAEVSAAKENILLAQTNVAQQETVLKNALSRNGVASPWLDDVHIVTLDRIHVPEKEDVKPTAELINEALLQRPELERARTNLQSLLINVAGTRNALLPTLQAFADFSSNALSGDVNALASGSSGVPYPGFIGGYGSLFGQIFRRNYPNYSVGFSLNIPFRNRIAQADYVSDQLALRQGQLQLQRSINQVRVDVKIAVIGLQQARARYETAVATRVLAQQTLDAEQKRFQFGQSTIPLLVQAQRDLAQDQSAEVQATANYTHAKVAFDEAVGQTLDVNGISIEEARSGHVAWQSSIPDLGPGQKGSQQK
ncbi:MAG TPA: TolC family protein [Bryobacteraceae bacterium]|nr:TolC family protein [Bryobacteraceae bacterium]